MKQDVILCPALEVGAGYFSDCPPGQVTLSGKVFEVGEYPDRGFSISADEMDAAIAAFRPVANDLEHSRLRDVLGNSLGELRRLWRVGRDVYGEVVVPQWLAQLTGNALKVSLAFDRAKNVVGNALTLSPRVTDAEVAAAFSWRDRPEGDAQRLHDLAVAQGAQCGSRQSFLDRLSAMFAKRPDAVPAVRVNLEPMAARFADEAIQARKFLPVDRPYLAKAFEAALIADSAASFTEGAAMEGECCEALRQMVAERPPYEFERERLSGEPGRLAPGDGISEERRNELLGKTDLGREVKKVTSKARGRRESTL